MNIFVEIINLSDKVSELRNNAILENPKDNPMIDAYNDGVDAMNAEVQKYLNAIALNKAFYGGVQ